MKPKELKMPDSWGNGQILINDGVWYVPKIMAKSLDSGNKFIFPGWSHSTIFGNTRPVNVEYCSGNGAWIAAKALANPLCNWVAIEKKFDRVRKIWSKVKNMKLSNVLIICGEAYDVTKRFFEANSFHNIYINFPDPWPKNRHAKHRLIQEAFVEELWRVLIKEHSLTFVTDDPPYSAWLIAVMHRHGKFVSTYPDPYYATELADYGSSYFDQLWRSKGRSILYHQFAKTFT
jgi:tRNA (guanine-N7-)-methyltransferase